MKQQSQGPELPSQPFFFLNTNKLFNCKALQKVESAITSLMSILRRGQAAPTASALPVPGGL